MDRTERIMQEWDAHPVTRAQMEALIQEINEIRELLMDDEFAAADRKLKGVSDALIETISHWPK